MTEGITGVNLPACQLLIGCGVPLWRIPQIRALYEGQAGAGAGASAFFDLEATPQRAPDGHVVAVRITAEDAADGFKPTAGHIDELHFRWARGTGAVAQAGGEGACNRCRTWCGVMDSQGSGSRGRAVFVAVGWSNG